MEYLIYKFASFNDVSHLLKYLITPKCYARLMPVNWFSHRISMSMNIIFDSVDTREFQVALDTKCAFSYKHYERVCTIRYINVQHLKFWYKHFNYSVQFIVKEKTKDSSMMNEFHGRKFIALNVSTRTKLEVRCVCSIGIYFCIFFLNVLVKLIL